MERFIRHTAIAALLAGLSLPSAAAEVADIAKHREATMKAVGGHFGAMSALQKGVPAGEGELAMHAQALADLAKIVPATFPEGSLTPKSHATPDIWKKPEAFKKVLDKYQQASAAMPAAAAKGGPELAEAMKALGGTCKSCHDDFTKE